MNLKFSGLLAAVAVLAFSSCSSVYQSGQTPDDVYYSPGKAVAPVAARQNNQDNDGAQGEYLETNGRRGTRSVEQGYGDYSYRDDQYLRMMIASGRRNSYYDDMYYNGGLGMVDPWMTNNWRWNSYMTWNTGFNSPYSSMWYWNSFYNPYYNSFYSPYYGGGFYGGGFYGGGFNGHLPGKGPNWNYTTPSRPSSSFAMGSYLNTNGTRNGSGYRPGTTYQNYNNSNNRNYYNTNSNGRRSVFGNNNENNRSYNNNSGADRPSRSYSPPSNSGGAGNRSSSPSSGGGGVSRPTRTGN